MALSGAYSNGALVDGTDKALVIMDDLHSAVHRGLFYEAFHFDAAVADDASVSLLVQTPALPATVHMQFGMAVGGDVEVEIFEGVTISDAGTAVVSRNRNRLSSTVAGTVVTHSPTTTGLGVKVSNFFVPGGTGPVQSLGGQGSTYSEWVLDMGAIYCMRVTNRSGSLTPISLLLTYYEPSP